MAQPKDRYEAYAAAVERAKEPWLRATPSENPCVQCVNARKGKDGRICRLSGKREADIEAERVTCPNSRQLERLKQCVDCAHATKILDCRLTGRFQQHGLGEHYLDCPKWAPKDDEAVPKTH